MHRLDKVQVIISMDSINDTLVVINISSEFNMIYIPQITDNRFTFKGESQSL